MTLMACVVSWMFFFIYFFRIVADWYFFIGNNTSFESIIWCCCFFFIFCAYQKPVCFYERLEQKLIYLLYIVIEISMKQNWLWIWLTSVKWTSARAPSPLTDNIFEHFLPIKNDIAGFCMKQTANRYSNKRMRLYQVNRI